MGKPFDKELLEINETYKWSANTKLDVDSKDLLRMTSFPMLAVGSGGSFSACSYLSLLHQEYGNICKSITPLELHSSKNVIRNANVFFLSASGKNSDILFGFNLSIQNEAKNIFSLCMRKNSPLAKLSKNYSASTIIDFNHPSGKDGFLATNSLVSFFVILARIFNKFEYRELTFEEIFLNRMTDFCKSLDKDFTIQVLYGGWGAPIAIDIESKFTEAGLGNILLADFRNFAHGRHNWFDKKKRQSAVIAIVTPSEKELAQKTLALLPKSIPRLIIETTDNTPNGAIELLIKSFYLTKVIGELKEIDPGRPGVPEYGRKLYNLKYASLYKSKRKVDEDFLIRRKIGLSDILQLSDDQYSIWYNSLLAFKKSINSSRFAGIIFDYDGTLCSSKERYHGPSELIREQLLRILQSDIVIGIVTGRGKSVRLDLQKFIPKKFWNKVILGYYNGSQISMLDDDKAPDASKPKANSLEALFSEISNHFLIGKFLTEDRLKIEPRPQQLTIEINDQFIGALIKEVLLDIVAKYDYKDIKVLQSSHSIDIILNTVSKLHILQECERFIKSQDKEHKFLCIGDCGKWPGNDYQLLGSKYSLSVDEVSTDPDTCWNLASPGIRNIDATLQYLQAITVTKNSFSIKL